MSTEKKLTPLQEAIKECQSLRIKEPVNIIQRDYNSLLDETIRYLKSLLPKEKEFAREMWDKSALLEDYHWAEGHGHTEKPPTFDEVYKQYEP